jgi:sulfane dehydrogenase subunit SoxC
MDEKERAITPATDSGTPGSGLALSRRGFLRAGAAAGAMAAGTGAALAEGTPDPLITEIQPWAQGWGDGVDASPYGLPIRFEGDVVRRNVSWLTADVISSINFTPIHALDGTITPAGCAFERHHSGAIELAKEDYRLMIHGLVEKPLVFTYEDLERFPRVNRTYFLECAANTGMEWAGAQLNGAQFTHGMIHNMEYSGVTLRTLLEEAGVKPEGKWIYVEGADASSNGRSIPLEKALDDCLVAFRANGEALRKEHGYPVRLCVPGWEGNMWVKWLRRIEVTENAVESREETSKYTDTLEDGTSRKWTWVMDAKSVVTSPSPQAPIKHGKGPLVITGLAWSGRGAITAVDVSVDGGKTWTEARLAAPGQKMALTRFYLDIEWDGSEMLLQSRATDETGYVQPTKNQLREIRGENSVYHNNCIQTWWVKANGEAENVEVS